MHHLHDLQYSKVWRSVYALRGGGGERDSPASSLSMALSHDSGLLMWGGGRGGEGGGREKEERRGEEREVVL